MISESVCWALEGAHEIVKNRWKALVARPMIVLFTVSGSPAGAVGTYDNAALADKALTYVGRWGGDACSDAGRSPVNGHKIVSLPNVRRVVADLKLEGGTWTHRLYILASDGPYEVWWRDGGAVSNPHRLWNIAYRGGTTSRSSEYWWTPGGTINGGTLHEYTSTSIVDIEKSAGGGFQNLYAVVGNRVYETWWGGGNIATSAIITIT